MESSEDRDKRIEAESVAAEAREERRDLDAERRACCDLIEAEIVDAHEPRHAGRFVWYRILREPEATS